MLHWRPPADTTVQQQQQQQQHYQRHHISSFHSKVLNVIKTSCLT